uniref:Oxidoreductase domain-containing protein n=1 Tax=uncultured marine thaumarchaeote AD1000_106_A06 TaxID=1455888 RepID=A0A075FI66_9ARCH|nr:oxidoreductase domain-containing protein [uncultured marine thaumarchaeote AD1000_106_A06]
MKVIQIGVGGWGKNHSRVLSEFGVLSAVCDANSERAEEFGKKYSVNFYDSFESLLEQEEFDAALVCTPTFTHSDIATRLIENKKHVFVEKPMTYLSEDGQNLIEFAKRNNVILTCGYIERFNPAVASVKDFIKSQKYGDLIRLEFYREHRMPQHIKDVGVIYDTSVHDIDTAMWLFDETPEVVFAIAGKINHEHEDFATITLGFKDNKTATISSNWITPIRVRNFNAVCTEARIFSDFITQEIRIETDNGTENPKNEKAEPLSLEIKNFIDAIKGKNDLVVKPEQAVNVTKVAEAALLSSQRGTPIYLDLR